MPDYNVALGVNPPQPINLQPLGVLAQLQQAQAHTGLYELQAEKQKRTILGTQAYIQAMQEGKQDDANAALASFGDPEAASKVQELYQTSKKYAAYDKYGAGASSGDAASIGQVGRADPAAAKTFADAYSTQMQAIKTGGEIHVQHAEMAGRVGNTLAAARNADGSYSPDGVAAAVALGQKFGFIQGDLQAEQYRKMPPQQLDAMSAALRGAGQAAKDFAETSGAAARNKAEGTAPFDTVTLAPGESLFSKQQIANAQGVVPNMAQPPAGAVPMPTPRPPQAPLVPGQATPAPQAVAPLPITPAGTNPMIATPGQPQPIVAGLNPQRLKEAETLGGEAGPIFKKATDDANAAQNVKYRLGLINHSIEGLGPNWMGTGADLRAQVSRGWNTFIQTALPDSAKGLLIDPAKIATWEDFNKQTTNAGYELARTLGSREAMQIVQGSISSVPNANQTYLGAKLVSSGMEQAAQRQQDLHEFLSRRVANGETVVGAEATFNRMHPAKEYTLRAIAGAVPPDAVEYLKNNPDTWRKFDKQFGAGMADYVRYGEVK